MLRCKEIARVLSSEEELNWMKRTEIRLHLMMCKHCSRYARQLRMMRDGFKKLFSKLTQVDPKEVHDLEQSTLERLKKQKHG